MNNKQLAGSFPGSQMVSSKIDSPGGRTIQADRGAKHDGGTAAVDWRERRNPDRKGK